ncbi:MAG: DUF58 domain-containing protein [Vicinamibacterales bacterium]
MSRPHVVTPAELSALRDLELVTRATVEGLRHGLHRSPFHGYSAEFSQYRHYQPGDDLKYVDWKALARTNRIYTRQFRETTNLNALFVVDVSRSMDYPQGKPKGLPPPSGGDQPSGGDKPLGLSKSKFALAQAVTAILGTLILDQGDAAGVIAVGDRAHLVPARSGHHHLRVFLSQVAALAPTGTAPVYEALRRAATVMTRRGLVVLVSDLYEEDRTLAEVGRLARMGHDVVVIHILSREELTLGVGGAVEMVDLENGRTLVVQPSAVRASYTAALNAWIAAIEKTIRREGLEYLRLVTDEPLEPAMRRFLVSRRGRA